MAVRALQLGNEQVTTWITWSRHLSRNWTGWWKTSSPNSPHRPQTFNRSLSVNSIHFSSFFIFIPWTNLKSAKKNKHFSGKTLKWQPKKSEVLIHCWSMVSFLQGLVAGDVFLIISLFPVKQFDQKIHGQKIQLSKRLPCGSGAGTWPLASGKSLAYAPISSSVDMPAAKTSTCAFPQGVHLVWLAGQPRRRYFRAAALQASPDLSAFEISIPAIQVQIFPFEGPVILTWRIIPFSKNSSAILEGLRGRKRSPCPRIQILGWSSPISSMGLVYLPTWKPYKINHLTISNIDSTIHPYTSINMGSKFRCKAPVFSSKKKRRHAIQVANSQAVKDAPWFLGLVSSTCQVAITVGGTYGCFNAGLRRQISDMQLGVICIHQKLNGTLPTDP